MMESTPIALEFARFCVRVRAAGLPEAVAARTRLAVTDHLHAVMRGAGSETAALLARYAGNARGPAMTGETTGLFFGALSTVREIDDVHRDTSMHTGSTVVAAALGAALDAAALKAAVDAAAVDAGTGPDTLGDAIGGVLESMVAGAIAGVITGAIGSVTGRDIPDVTPNVTRDKAIRGSGVTGSDILAAVALGYEMGIRLSVAAGERHYHYFHSTATCGTVAAAVAASAVFGLDEDATARAIGLAATSASGLWEDISTGAIGVKHLHSGFAAERGIRAARLAALGADGARFGLEGPKGFLAAMARPVAEVPGESAPGPEALRAMLLDGLGERWAVTRNIFKRYAFCLGCFEPLECIREAMGNRKAVNVSSVLVEMYPPVAALVGGGVGREDENGTIAPRTGLQAKFSAPFALALVLAGHDPENAELPDAWLDDPEVRRWYPRIRCVPDPDLKPRHARVTITWRDGSHSEGNAVLRDLTPDEVMGRFALVCKGRLEERAPRFKRLAENLPSLDSAEVAEFLALAKDAAGCGA